MIILSYGLMHINWEHQTSEDACKCFWPVLKILKSKTESVSIFLFFFLTTEFCTTKTTPRLRNGCLLVEWYGFGQRKWFVYYSFTVVTLFHRVTGLLVLWSVHHKNDYKPKLIHRFLFFILLSDSVGQILQLLIYTHKVILFSSMFRNVCDWHWQ